MKMAEEERLVTGGRPEMYMREIRPSVWMTDGEEDRDGRGAAKRDAGEEPREAGQHERGEVERDALGERIERG